jgi:hypothetical protein
MEDRLGFIILRHVNNNITATYWIKSYVCIRKHYPNANIIIIDDNSDYNYINTELEKNLYKVRIIKSEYKQRGELLPYIYYLENKHCDYCCIIHDSVFTNAKVDLYTNTASILWSFEHHYNKPKEEIDLIKTLNNHEELLELYKEKDKWLGCFGGMTVINHSFLCMLDARYNFKNMIHAINSRKNRMCFERVISVIIHKNLMPTRPKYIFNDIHKYCRWGVGIDRINMLKHLPFIKVWSGR